MHLPYVFDHAVFVRWGAPMSAPGIFPRKGIGIGPGGRGSPAGDRDVDWLMFVSAFSCEWLHRTAESRFGTFIQDTIPRKFHLSAYLQHILYVFCGCGKLNELD